MLSYELNWVNLVSLAGVSGMNKDIIKPDFYFVMRRIFYTGAVPIGTIPVWNFHHNAKYKLGLSHQDFNQW